MPASGFPAQESRARSVCVTQRRGKDEERVGVGVRRVMRDKRIFSGLPQRVVGGGVELERGGLEIFSYR